MLSSATLNFKNQLSVLLTREREIEREKIYHDDEYKNRVNSIIPRSNPGMSGEEGISKKTSYLQQFLLVG